MLSFFLSGLNPSFSQNTFTGNTNTDWLEDTNWSTGTSPGCGTTINESISVNANSVISNTCAATNFSDDLIIQFGATLDFEPNNWSYINVGGYFENNGTFNLNMPNTFIGLQMRNNGTTNVNNGTINLNSGVFRARDGGNFTNESILNVNNGGALSAWSGTSEYINNGTITIHAGGRFFIGFSTTHIFKNYDLLTFNSSLSNDFCNVTNMTGGIMDIQSGSNFTFRTQDGIHENETGAEIIADGTLTVSSNFTNNGTISGSGTVNSSSGSANLGGTIQPGNSVGILNTTNDITFSGTVEIEVTGRGDNVCAGTAGAAGTTFDQITSTNSGNITISNDLSFDFTGASGLTNGDSYTLISSGGTVSYSGVSPIVSGGYTMTHVSGGLFQLTAGGTDGPEVFEGPGTDYLTNANWCDGSSSGCATVTVPVTFDADCTMPNTCGISLFWQEDFIINSGKTVTYEFTSFCGINGGNGYFENNGIFNINGNHSFRFSNSATHINYGTINVNNGSFFMFNATLQNDGTLNLNEDLDWWNGSGTLDNNSSVVATAPGRFIAGFGGTVNIDNSGTITLGSSGNDLTNLNNGAGGTVTVNGSANVGTNTVNTGTINGSGTLISSSADLAGTIQPGNSVGILNTTNAITFSGEIDMEITGRGDSDGGVAGTDFDQISSTNAATITLDNATVDLIFTGTNFYNGDTYTLFDAGAVTIVGTLSITNNNGYIINHLGNGVFEIFSGALPVELIYFTALENDQTVILQWRTASELNNQGFEIQRSANGTDWEEIAFVIGYGTTLEEQSYAHTDERPLPGMNYYRLKQVDFDGQFDYSQVVSVNLKKQDSEINLFPNPAKNRITVSFHSKYIGAASATIFNHLGQRVKAQTLLLEGGAFSSGIDLAGLPAGVYFLEIIAGNEQWRERLVVE